LNDVTREQNVLCTQYTERTVPHVYIPPIATMLDLERAIVRCVEVDKMVQRVQRKEKKKQRVPREQACVESRYRLIAKLGYQAPLSLVHSGDITVRKSKLHGLGVFATRELPADVLVTFYPVHYATDGDGKNEEGQTMALDTLGRPLYDQITLYDPTARYARHYGIKKGRLAVIGHPALRDDTRLLGHLVNDPGGNRLRNMTPETLCSAVDIKTLAIVQDLLTHVNCRFVTDSCEYVIAVQTQRVIQKGEELLCLYDTSHWLQLEFGLDWLEKFPFMKKYCV
jgi:hypothetical protein